MKRLLATVAFLALCFPTGVLAQRWAYPTQSGYPPYGFKVFTDWQPANLRLDVSQGDAQVVVDGRYVGHVEDFNRSFRRLTLSGGPHLVEIRKAGYKSLAFEIAVFPGQNVTVSRTMQRARNTDTPEETEAIAPSFEEGAFLPGTDGPSGDLRLEVKPKDAEVYADGFYVGIVDDFNGSQHLMLTQGQHHLVLKHAGYETLEVTLSIDAAHADVYRAEMKKTN